MGWYGGYGSPTEIVEEFRTDCAKGGATIVKDALMGYGRRYYAAVTNKEGSTAVCLLSISGSKGSYGYKPMDEFSGPYEYDCPLAVLDAAGPDPVGDGGAAWAREWRAKVRAYWATRATRLRAAKTLTVGARVSGPGANSPYTVATLTPLTGYGTNGVRYRLSAAKVTVLEATS